MRTLLETIPVNSTFYNPLDRVLTHLEQSVGVVALYGVAFVVFCCTALVVAAFAKLEGVTTVFKVTVVSFLTAVCLGSCCIVTAGVFRATLGVEASPQTDKSSDWSINWSLVGVACGWIIGFAVIGAVAWFVWQHIIKRRDARHKLTEAEQARREAIARRNRLEVRGLDYALTHGLVNETDVQAMESAALQDRIDADNPMTDLLIPSLDRLAIYERDELVLSGEERKRRDDLRVLIHDLRMIPEVVQLRSMGPATDEFLVDANQRLERAKQLPEG